MVARGDRVVVARGVKVPRGTSGVVFWVGDTKYGLRVGLKDAAGTVHWTAMGNVDLADAPVAAPVAAVAAALASPAVAGAVVASAAGSDLAALHAKLDAVSAKLDALLAVLVPVVPVAPASDLFDVAFEDAA